MLSLSFHLHTIFCMNFHFYKIHALYVIQKFHCNNTAEDRDISVPFPSFFCKYLCTFAYLSKIQTISIYLFVLSLCLFELCVLSKLQHISNNPWQSWLHSHSQSASLSQSASSLQFLSSLGLSSVCICTMRTRSWLCIWSV